MGSASRAESIGGWLVAILIRSVNEFVRHFDLTSRVCARPHPYAHARSDEKVSCKKSDMGGSELENILIG